MINDITRFYGSALLTLIDSCENGYMIKKLFNNKPGFYLIDNKLPLMLKHATKRTGPWTFTLRSQCLFEYYNIFLKYGECLLLFVCGCDGIVALSSAEVMDIIQFNDGKDQKRISIARRLNEMYNITASDGKMNRRISQNSLQDKVDYFFEVHKRTI